MPKIILSPEQAEKNRLRARAWAQANKDRNRKRAAKWREENPERHKENCRRNYSENKEHRANYRRAYDKAKKDIVAQKGRSRRARKLKCVGSHTPEDILKLLMLQKGLCIYCKSDISKKYEIDHIMPLAKGGGDDKYNLQLLCKPCNSRKSDKLPEKYSQELGMLL
ncbi:HNH endonuclease [Burkholderia gladioli]|uniref:HNH endonuclease n=1 Tax=Burkholderia gladioli TaxID=28095 RepID=UPI00163F3B5B|nr:HNH endonuclease [Burkholderia gladioli]